MGCSGDSQTRHVSLPKRTESGSHLTPMGQALPCRGGARTAEVDYLKTHHHPLKVLKSKGGDRREGWNLEPGPELQGDVNQMGKKWPKKRWWWEMTSHPVPSSPPAVAGGPWGQCRAVTLLTQSHLLPSLTQGRFLHILCSNTPSTSPQECRHSHRRRTGYTITFILSPARPSTVSPSSRSSAQICCTPLNVTEVASVSNTLRRGQLENRKRERVENLGQSPHTWPP